MSGLFSEFAFFSIFYSSQVVDSCVLEDREEDKDEADPQVDVYGFDVGHSGHGRIYTCDDSGHGEHCGDAWGNKQTNKQKPKVLFYNSYYTIALTISPAMGLS